MQFIKNHPLFSIINGFIVDLPTPSNISYLWNFGSLVGVLLISQIITGILLSFHYSAEENLAFASINHIIKDVNAGYLIRYFHANGASFVLALVYLHIGRGYYYGSYTKTLVWHIGVTLYIMIMATAFLGYVLPWGQMSFWGATVITNLFTAIPIVGGDIAIWLWGGWNIGNPTLSRFFSLHYLLPFLIMALSLTHLIALHETGSNNPLGVKSDVEKIAFHTYFTSKDLWVILIVLINLFVLTIYLPLYLNDVVNWVPADSLKTPIHIQPEWYFLFAYSILRSIPNKLGGVITMFSAILVLYFIPFLHTSKLIGIVFRPLSKLIFWFMVCNVILLTWVGMMPVEDPFITIGAIATILYFVFPILILPILGLFEL